MENQTNVKINFFTQERRTHILYPLLKKQNKFFAQKYFDCQINISNNYFVVEKSLTLKQIILFFESLKYELNENYFSSDQKTNYNNTRFPAQHFVMMQLSND